MAEPLTQSELATTCTIYTYHHLARHHPVEVYLVEDIDTGDCTLITNYHHRGEAVPWAKSTSKPKFYFGADGSRYFMWSRFGEVDNLPEDILRLVKLSDFLEGVFIGYTRGGDPVGVFYTLNWNHDWEEWIDGLPTREQTGPENPWNWP